MEVAKLDGNDHVTTWAENKKGKEFGLYVTTTPGITQDQMEILFDIWQENMINCCNIDQGLNTLVLVTYCMSIDDRHNRLATLIASLSEFSL